MRAWGTRFQLLGGRDDGAEPDFAWFVLKYGGKKVHVVIEEVSGTTQVILKDITDKVVTRVQHASMVRESFVYGMIFGVLLASALFWGTQQ